MRIRATLGLGLITGLVTTALFWGAPTDGVILLCASVFGLLLGAIAALCILATDRWPRRVTALLVSLAPSLSLIGATKRLPALIELPALLAIPLLATLLRRATTRSFIRLNLLTALLLAYAAAGLPAAFLSDSIVPAITNLLPLALFFIGMLLQSGPPHASLGAQRASLLRLLAPALLCGAILLAVLALLLKPTGDAAQSCALSLGALALLAISWDSRRFYWRVVLGFPDRIVRVLAVVVAIAFLSTSAFVLARLASPGIIVALALALALVALSRQRFSEIALVVISFMPLLSGFGLEWLKPPLLALYGSLDAHQWNAALVEGVSTPFGIGFDGERGFRMYQGTFASTGVSGLATLVLMLLLMLILCARTYFRLRPSSGEAGGMLAAGGICIFVAVAGFFVNPLASPAIAMVLWLFLGMANGTIHAVGRVTEKVPSEAVQAQFDRLRGYPLRIAYVLPGDATGEAALTFDDYLHTFDRKCVQPMLLAVGDGPLVSLAHGLGVEARIVKVPPRPRTASVSKEVSRFGRSKPGIFFFLLLRSLDLRRWTLRRTGLMVQAALFLEPDLLVSKEVSRFGRSKPGIFFFLLLRSLDLRRWTLRRTRLMVRAALFLEPDLLVSLDPALHLATLSTGRVSGVPVQWHGHDVAPLGVQRTLDTLAPWTVGIIAPSKTIARTYGTRLVGRQLKVVRPSLPLESTPLAERGVVLQRLGLPAEAKVLAVVGPITGKSGHMDALEALLRLRRTMPDLCMVLLEEAPPHVLLDEHDTAALRISASATEAGGDAGWHLAKLRYEIAMNGLEEIMLLLGPRLDALVILAASDIIVFPQERATSSRNLLLAMASGTPLVATRTGTHAELLAEAWGYLLVKPRDPQGLVTSIAGVFQQQGLYRANASRNPGLVRGGYSPQVEMARLQRIYTDLCQPTGQTLHLPTSKEIAPLQRHWVTALWNPKAAD